MAQHTLDASGLLCPLPVLKAKKRLRGLSSGELLEVHATDPGAVQDFESLCETDGHALLESQGDGGKYRFLIRVGG